ncbi:putative Phytocyanin domain, cupredoxin [Helianthus anomalus]
MANKMLGIFILIATIVAQANAAQKHEIYWKYGKKYDHVPLQSFNTFEIGDTLVFIYPRGTHDVIEVDEKSFEDCVVPPSAKPLTSGKDVIKIDAPGKRWFICGFKNGKHCKDGGMKLMINIQKPVAPQGGRKLPN